MLLCRCPNCQTRIFFVSMIIREKATCPVCKKNFSLGSTQADEIPKAGFLDQIFEKIPIMDVGSREKELVFTEEDLAFLGEIFLLHIMAVDRWQELSREELNRISDHIKELIKILEESDQDSDLAKLKFNILNAFIRNFYD